MIAPARGDFPLHEPHFPENPKTNSPDPIYAECFEPCRNACANVRIFDQQAAITTQAIAAITNRKNTYINELNKNLIFQKNLDTQMTLTDQLLQKIANLQEVLTALPNEFKKDQTSKVNLSEWILLIEQKIANLSSGPSNENAIVISLLDDLRNTLKNLIIGPSDQLKKRIEHALNEPDQIPPPGNYNDLMPLLNWLKELESTYRNEIGKCELEIGIQQTALTQQQYEAVLWRSEIERLSVGPCQARKNSCVYPICH